MTEMYINSMKEDTIIKAMNSIITLRIVIREHSKVHPSLLSGLHCHSGHDFDVHVRHAHGQLKGEWSHGRAYSCTVH